MMLPPLPVSAKTGVWRPIIETIPANSDQLTELPEEELWSAQQLLMSTLVSLEDERRIKVKLDVHLHDQRGAPLTIT